MHVPFSSQKKIDQEFLPFLHKLIHEEYHYLAPYNQRAQKQRFYNTGELDLEYPAAKQLSLDVKQTELDEMCTQIERSHAPATVKDLYQAKFVEQQKIINILCATSRQDDETFHTTSSSLYGTPDPKLFWVVVKQINNQFNSLIAKVDQVGS